MQVAVCIGIGILLGICVTVITLVVIIDTGAGRKDCIRTDTRKHTCKRKRRGNEPPVL
jgi:hypothetical protein